MAKTYVFYILIRKYLINLQSSNHFTKAVYFRLFLDQVLPDDIDTASLKNWFASAWFSERKYPEQ